MVCFSIVQIAVLNEKADEAMMLKFGRIVDLDRLEGLSVNHIVGELRGKLRKVEQKREQEVALVETKINAEKRRLAAMTRENTQRLNRLHDLRSTKDRLEKRLNARQKSMVSVHVHPQYFLFISRSLCLCMNDSVWCINDFNFSFF